MRACVFVLLINAVVVWALPRRQHNSQNQIVELQEYLEDVSNSSQVEDYNDDLNTNRIYRHRPLLHHHHHQNVYSGYENPRAPVGGFDRNDISAKLRFFYKSIDEYTELPLDRAKEIFSTSWYNANKTTVFFAHGFTGHPKGPAVMSVVNAYLNLGDHNVILFNWDEMAAGFPPSLASTYVNSAMPNSRKLGVYFAQTLKELSSAGMDLNKSHFIGHSLGAHIFGIAGNTLQNDRILLPWITGLDPAAYGFENRPSLPQLNPRSATFVAVIHSDPSKYGFRKPLGTVDFWLNFKNGAVIQPGCTNRPSPMFSSADLCNHNRSWQVLIDALKYPGTLLGSWAKNFRQWKSYSIEERNTNVLNIGTIDNNAPQGNYFITTNAESPYGRGKDGL